MGNKGTAEFATTDTVIGLSAKVTPQAQTIDTSDHL
jgi:hypothetical protein